MPVETSSNSPTHISPRRLWFGTTVAAISWALHGAVCEVISDQACQNGGGSLGPFSPAGVRWLLAGITLVALGFAAAGAIASTQNWRHLSAEEDLVHAEGRRREQFMALVGIFAGVAFLIGILWAGLPLVLLDVCVKAR